MVDGDVAVVGLGAMGSAIAYHLARRGVTVLGFDRWHPPHGMGSSGGGTRIIRAAYHEGSGYVPLATRAAELWRTLENESGQQLLRTTGTVMIGPADGDIVPGAAASAAQYGLPHERWSHDELRSRLPWLQATPHHEALWEPDAGVLDPEACIQAHLAGARKAGARLFFDQPVLTWSVGAGAVAIATTAETLRAQLIVVAAGAWTGDLLRHAAPEQETPDERAAQPGHGRVDGSNETNALGHAKRGRTDPGRALDLGLTIERQVQVWFPWPAVWRDPTVVLVEYAPGCAFYVVPDHGAGTVKAAVHHQGATGPGPYVDTTVTEGDIAKVRDLLARFIPDLDAPHLAAAVCRYTNTPDRSFVIDHHPQATNVVVVSACSGHGFKFASAIGEAVADLIEGRRPALIADYALTGDRGIGLGTSYA